MGSRSVFFGSFFASAAWSFMPGSIFARDLIRETITPSAFVSARSESDSLSVHDVSPFGTYVGEFFSSAHVVSLLL